VLNHPSAFTTCIQEAADSNWWMFPSAESDDWLCAKRISEAAPAAL
jgi:proteinaceous RNase P